MAQMKRLLLLPVLAQLLLVPALSQAGEGVPTPDEVRKSEGMPPVIPHRVADVETGKECLTCHEEGKGGAPVTSHPERLMCTQCHVRGEVKGKAKGKAKAKKR